MKKELYSLFFILLLTTIFLISSITDALGRDLEEIQKEGIIYIGCKDSFRPFGFIDSNSKWVGFDVDIARTLAKELQKDYGLKTEWVKINRSSDRIKFLQEGKVDIVIASFSITEERKKLVDFSKPYFLNEGLAILTWKNNNINRLEDLKGKKIAVTGGSTGEKFLLKKLPEAIIIPVANDDTAIKLLLQHQVDAYMQDKSVCDYHILRNIDLKELPEVFSLGKEKDYYGFGLSKGAHQLKKYCNDFIDKIKKNGVYQKIFNKWFSQKGINEKKWQKTISFLEAIAYKLLLESDEKEAKLAGEILKNFVTRISFQTKDEIKKELFKYNIHLKNGMMFRNSLLLKENNNFIEILDEKGEHYLIPYSAINFIKRFKR